jgi:16S rRNA (uracil1498-N3)-methyltransferase
MRAVHLKTTFNENDIGSSVSFEGDQARHLIKVIRIKKHEEILIFNGLGQKTLAAIEHTDRKTVTIKVLKVDKVKDERNLSLLLGVPKKDAFENIVKMAAEIGIKNIYLFRSEFSQLDVEVSDRLLKIEESANIQSNNPFTINFVKIDSLKETISSYESVINFSTFSKGDLSQSLCKETLLIIGPEAGFSKDEEELINSMGNVSVCQLPTNIMRAPTAFAVGVGYLLAKF